MTPVFAYTASAVTKTGDHEIKRFLLEFLSPCSFKCGLCRWSGRVGHEIRPIDSLDLLDSCRCSHCIGAVANTGDHEIKRFRMDFMLAVFRSNAGLAMGPKQAGTKIRPMDSPGLLDSCLCSHCMGAVTKTGDHEIKRI